MTTTYRWKPEWRNGGDPAFANLPAEGVNPAEIVAKMTPAGAWTKKTLAAWGVPWPPPGGWKAELERRWEARNNVAVVVVNSPDERPAAVVMSQEQIKHASFSRAIRELQMIRHRYRDVDELTEVFGVVDREIERLATSG